MKLGQTSLVTLWVTLFVVISSFAYAKESNTVLETVPQSNVELPISWDVHQFVSTSIDNDPTLAEAQYKKSIKSLRIKSIKNSAILPKFKASILFGPAPDINEVVETELVDGKLIETKETRYDFSTFGPYFGTKIEMAQPLNISRLRYGLMAAQADLDVTAWDYKKAQVVLNYELQKIYYGLSYAMSMNRLASKALKELTKVADKLEEALDEEDENVSQFDLLELKSNRYSLDKALYETEEGLARARLGFRFSLGEQGEHIQILDTLIRQRKDVIPPLEDLKKALYEKHPDLKKLNYGLKAKRALINLAGGEMGPGFFLFGEFKYAKSWAGDRTNFGEDAFSRDPINTIDGALGVGVQYNLNFWAQQDKLKKAKYEYNLLKKKDIYAATGLLLLMEEAYNKVTLHKKRIKSAQRSLRASDAWLKGAAMKYDIDPSQGGILLKAFKQNMSNRKDLYDSVYAYNLAVGALFSKVGWTLAEYQSIYNTKTSQ